MQSSDHVSRHPGALLAGTGLDGFQSSDHVPRRPGALLAGTGLALAGFTACAVALLLAGLVPAARFTGERIEIVVRPGAIEVDGLYVYEGILPLPWSQGLVVPFPTGGGQEAPATVSAELLDPAGGAPTPLTVRWLLGAPRLVVPVTSGLPTRVRVRFTQRVSGTEATYLLTTTRPWGAPLEHAEYALLPRCVEITSSSLGEGLEVTRDDFFPSEDWRFGWRERGDRCSDG